MTLRVAALAAGLVLHASLCSGQTTPPRADWLKDARLGVFMHVLPADADLARLGAFDVDGLAQIASTGARSPAASASPSKELSLAAIEARLGGRLGVAALDTGSGRRLEYRAGERFAMCSTFKLLLAAAVLARVDAGRESLDRRLPYGPSDLLEYAPVTREHLAAGGMTVAALCQAAVEVSDNSAANLLLATLGGPEGLTRYARSVGDETTRLDRLEPWLNANEPGDARDTTTPSAMAETVRKLLVGDALSAASRDRLESWLVASPTGARRLRAGLPADWRAGDKTGTGNNGATNDVAVVWPPGRAPIVVAAYLSESAALLAEREAALAEVGRLLASDSAGFERGRASLARRAAAALH